MPDKEELLASLGGVEAIREECARAVVRWEWYKGLNARDPVPFLSEACKHGKPRRLKSEPEDKEMAAKLGMDAAGRTLVRQTYFVYEGTPYPHDELFHYADDFILSVRMVTAMAGEPQERGPIRVMETRDGRVTSLGFSTYHYREDGLLERAVHRYNTQTYTYDELGVLLSITTEKGTRYRRKPKDTTMASAMKHIEELLLKEIPRVLARSAPEQPVCCVALVYSLTDEALPPLLGLMLESERDALLQKQDPCRAYWDPIEWSLFEDDRFALTSPQLIIPCELANQMCVEDDSVEPVRKMLWRVVKALSAQVNALLTTSEHFVFMAVNGQHIGLKKDLRQLARTLEPETKRTLKSLL